MLFFFIPEVPKSKAEKGNTKPNSCAVRSQKKKHFQKERDILFPDFTFEEEAIPTSLPIPTRSLQKLEASKSGERYQAVVLQVDLSKETALAPMKPSSTPNKNSAPVDRIWWVYPNTQVLPLPIIHIQLVQIPHLTFHRLPRLSDAKIRLQVLHAGELIPL